jgi:hypothetical protein
MGAGTSEGATMADQDGIPIEHQNRLGVILYFDVNFVDCETRAARDLRRYHATGWITLLRCDTLDTELGDTKDGEKRQELLAASAPYIEALGPAVFGSSRLDHTVFGSDEDDARLDRVYSILFPGSDRRDDSTNRARRKVRDAMHLATAIRYGGNGFITLDERDLLRKSHEIAKAFNGFQVVSPEPALAFVERVKARFDGRGR